MANHKGENKKISEKLKGNKNAEKWTLTEATKLFSDSLVKALEKEKNAAGKETNAYKYDFIGEVARDLNTYHHVYAHLVTQYPELKSKFTELKATLEANCYFNTKKGNIREAIGIVNLKSNHKWTDRTQIDTNVDAHVHIGRKKWAKNKEEE